MPMLERQGCQVRVISMAPQLKPEIRSSQASSRIDLQELKVQMIKRIGPHKSRQYFECFKGYICSKYRKPHLDKQILLIIGRDNVGLHNEIIKAVLSNAVKGEVPPPTPFSRCPLKPMKRKTKKPGLELRTGDMDNGAASSVANASRAHEPDNDMKNIDEDTLSQKSADGSVEQPETDVNCISIRPGKQPNVNVTCSFTDKEIDSGLSILTANKSEAFIESWRNQLIRPPPGAPFGTHTFRKSGLTESLAQLFLTKVVGTQILETDSLPDAETLERHMEYIAMAEGLESVNADSVTVLNQGLDIFLKKLIRVSINYARSKFMSLQEPQSQEVGSSSFSSCKREMESKSADDKFRKNLHEGETPNLSISLMDFKFAMERNPEQLGEEWPLQLEKILLRTLND